MNFIELTRPDVSIVLLNKNTIVLVYTYDDHTMILCSGGIKQQVKETYEQVKSILTNSMILN